MERPEIASREEWLAARLELLAKEKELSRAQAALAARRRKLPMVEIGKDYAFTGPNGPARLADLFGGRGQLIIYHFMWLHPIGEGCPSCSFAVDNMPDPVHLNKGADTTLALVSRAPFERIEQFRERMGWTLPWYSSAGSDFNYDFHVSSDEAIALFRGPPQERGRVVRRRDERRHRTHGDRAVNGYSAGHAGDFAEHAGRFRRELLAFCYRMLGSFEDAEEVVQETYLSAWRSYGTFEGRSSVRTWLYRIAARACLNTAEREKYRPLPSGLGGPGPGPDGPIEAGRQETAWLQPFPSDPASIAETRDTMRLALIVALQHLPPRQRAVLILRDVLERPPRSVSFWT